MKNLIDLFKVVCGFFFVCIPLILFISLTILGVWAVPSTWELASLARFGVVVGMIVAFGWPTVIATLAAISLLAAFWK